jgi:hypothetical protein
MLLDFHADWCLPCKELELRTFSNTEVARALGGFGLVKVGCTADDGRASTPPSSAGRLRRCRRWWWSGATAR